jgi:hypothetical protein
MCGKFSTGWPANTGYTGRKWSDGAFLPQKIKMHFGRKCSTGNERNEYFAA